MKQPLIFETKYGDYPVGDYLSDYLDDYLEPATEEDLNEVNYQEMDD